MSPRAAAWLLASILLARLATIGVAPLFDKTEGRYGEIGREMAESGDWVTPTLHGGEPFWGKPPLHFWATAAAIRLFGVNEFAARLPSFLAGIGILLATYVAGLKLFRRRGPARTAVVVLASSLLFYLLAGQVMLDGTFTAAVTGSLASYAAITAGAPRRSPAGYLFFLFLGLALLAKGPVGVVLVGIVVALHALFSRSAASMARLPWLAGPALTIAAAAPWFVLAERKTPGFLRYFFVNEHILRYTRSDYGDLYGHGHVAPYGLIWLLAAAALLPWTPVLLAKGWRSFRRRRIEPMDAAERYLWTWAVAAPLFFTFSRSLSFPYIFPALPPLALLLGRHLHEGRVGARLVAGSALGTAAVLLGGTVYGAIDFRPPAADVAFLALPLLALALFLLLPSGAKGVLRPLAAALVVPLAVAPLTLFWHDEIGLRKSTRHLAAAVGGEPRGGAPLFFDGLPLSAEFYFRGKAIDLKGDAAELRRRLESGGGEILFVRKSREKYLPEFGDQPLRSIGESGRYTIYRMPRGGGAGGE